MKTMIVFETGGGVEVYFYESYFLMILAAEKEVAKGNNVVVRE